MSPTELAPAAGWTGLTVACYLAGLGVRRLARNHALANPALITMALVAGALLLSHTPYAVYFHATRGLTFLLAPATVALGVPLARNFIHVRRSWLGVGLGLLAGSVSSMVSGVLLVRWLGGSKVLALSMLPKAATTPIAMAVTQQIGGPPALSATLAIAGGAGLGTDHGHACGGAGGGHGGERNRGGPGGGTGGWGGGVRGDWNRAERLADGPFGTGAGGLYLRGVTGGNEAGGWRWIDPTRSG